MMKQLAYTSQTCGGGKIEEPEVLVWASRHQLASSTWLAGGVVLNCYNSWLLLFYLSGRGSTRPCKHIHGGPRRVWDPSLWGWIPSHQYSTLALVFVLWWGFPPKELAVVTNKPWSKCGHPCSHLTLQKSTHARAENADTRDHTTPLPFQVDLLLALVSGKGSGNRFQYWAQKNSWFITHSANLAKLHKKVKAQKHPFCEHLMPSSSPQLF